MVLSAQKNCVARVWTVDGGVNRWCYFGNPKVIRECRGGSGSLEGFFFRVLNLTAEIWPENDPRSLGGKNLGMFLGQFE